MIAALTTRGWWCVASVVTYALVALAGVYIAGRRGVFRHGDEQRETDWTIKLVFWPITAVCWPITAAMAWTIKAIYRAGEKSRKKQ